MKPNRNDGHHTGISKAIDYNGIRYFKAEEVLYLGDTHHATMGVKNEYPPIYLWCNIVDTVMVADAIRQELDKPITILSGYRSKEYNAAIGGKAESQHLYFRALDLKSDNALSLYRAAVKLRDNGLFKGGIGKYPWGIHLDTRGYNVTF